VAIGYHKLPGTTLKKFRNAGITELWFRDEEGNYYFRTQRRPYASRWRKDISRPEIENVAFFLPNLPRGESA